MKSRSNNSTPAHLLMVDDNKMGLNARKSVMEELGYQVSTVSTPAEALERLSKDHFDLVITDYKMPGMNGTELIKRMRKQEYVIPVVLISGFVDALGLNEANTGADVVILKSAHEVSNMVRSVRSLLRRTSAKKPAASQTAASRTAAARKQRA
ncbi:MAG: response regulator [Acidobacteriia bacterium]|nr:response regulator [Terriglobia bacterium]